LAGLQSIENGNGRKAPGTKFEVPLCIGEAV
jgi:hypothetical protein